MIQGRQHNIVVRASRWALRLTIGLSAVGAGLAAQAQDHRLAALQQLGRVATPAEVQAWDIDVRADFKGLPRGVGSVTQGQQVWDAKCASCHGVFGESNEVFTPIVGGTTAQDIATGRVKNLAGNSYPQRTTMMKVSQISTLWDYINRAMPWNAPKSLSHDEVYAVLAYMLHLADVLPSDFTLSDRNMAEVQQRLPNRNGKVFHAPLWNANAKGDVLNPLCMVDCPVESRFASALPEHARNAHGNIAEQVRPFGSPRGTDTSAPSRQVKAGSSAALALVNVPARAVVPVTSPAPAIAPDRQPDTPDVNRIVQSSGCTACHGLSDKIVGPSFREIARRYGSTHDAVEYLSGKISRGSTGIWGAVPMPEQAQVKDADRRAMAQWLAAGAK